MTDKKYEELIYQTTVQADLNRNYSFEFLGKFGKYWKRIDDNY